MLVIFIAAFFCVFNVCLWCAFFSKFKKIFSTDDIIASTREQMDYMISDFNRNAGRNIELIEDRIKQLRSAVAEADRHLEVIKHEIEVQKSSVSYQQKIDSAIQTSRVRQQYLRNSAVPNQYTDISGGLNSLNSYELTDEGNMHVSQRNHPNQNGELFKPEDYDNYQIVSKTGTRFTVENDGSSYTSVPVLDTNIAYADEPIVPKKSFKEMVYDLTAAGHSVEEIASELNRSTTEVQCVLDMGF